MSSNTTMKLTSKRLKQIIKEELGKIKKEGISLPESPCVKLERDYRSAMDERHGAGIGQSQVDPAKLEDYISGIRNQAMELRCPWYDDFDSDAPEADIEPEFNPTAQVQMAESKKRRFRKKRK